MTCISSNDVLECRVEFRNPFRIDRLSWMSRLHRAAFRPRRRMSKRLVGRPAKKLFRFVFASGWTGAPSVFQVRNGDDWRPVAFSPRNTQFGALYMPQNKPLYEPETTALLDLLVGPKDVFFDIGANWGYYAVFLASRDDYQGRIEAFEPFPSSFADLTETVEQAGFAGTINTHGIALSDREGTADMAAWDGIQSGLARLGEADDSSKARRTEVPLRSLDSMELPAPHIIKVDAEDHEENVFAGAAGILKQARPMIVFENWLHPENPRLTQGPIALLAKERYRFFAVGWRLNGYEGCIVPDLPDPGEREATLALAPFLPENRFFLPGQLNILAVPEEKTDNLKARFRSAGGGTAAMTREEKRYKERGR